MQGLPWACWRLTDTTGRCAVRFCNYFWGLGRASSKPGGVMAQRPLGPGQHGGRPMVPADAPAHSASICPGRGVRLGPHRRRLAKKKGPSPAPGWRAEEGPSKMRTRLPHLWCGNGPLFSASLMQTRLPHLWCGLHSLIASSMHDKGVTIRLVKKKNMDFSKSCTMTRQGVFAGLVKKIWKDRS